MLIEGKKGNGRGSGGLPKGAYITKAFLGDLQKGEVTLAVKTFLRFNSKYKVKPTSRDPQGKISIHLDVQKLPPMGDDLVLKSASVVPMLSTEWQGQQDPEDRVKSAMATKFRWDGKFIANPKVMGRWNIVTEVTEVAAFNPAKRVGRVRRPLFSTMTFKDGGMTHDTTWMWSGDTLMDLTKFQALKMQVKIVGGAEYLFVEAGGFGTRNKPGWKPKLYVLKR
jgi:hypothetical protein